MLRSIVRLLAIVMLGIVAVAIVAVVAGLASGNPAQLLVGIAVAIVAGALAATLWFVDRTIGPGTSTHL